MTGNPLVLVPGLLCTDALFEPQVGALGRIAAITIADHTRHTTMSEIADAILDEAPERFSLAGLSMGGYVAFEVVRRAPERVKRLALIDSSARADRPEQSEQRRRLISLGEREGIDAVVDELLPLLVRERALGDSNLVAGVRAMARETGLAAFRRQQEAIIARPDNRAFLAEIACPTVIIVGREDKLTPLKVAEEMAAGIDGSDLEVIEDCGHLATLEQPDAVTAILKRWLAATA